MLNRLENLSLKLAQSARLVLDIYNVDSDTPNVYAGSSKALSSRYEWM